MAISLELAYAYARAAGATDSEAKYLAAIAVPESGLNPDAHNGNASTGDNSYGLWQINMLGQMGVNRAASWGLSSYDQLLDPMTNATAALAVLRSQGFTAWSTYKSGAYQAYLPAATSAAGNVGENYEQYLAGHGASSTAPYSSSGSGPSTNTNGSNGAVADSPAPGPTQVPKDGTVYHVGSYTAVVYQVSPGLFVAYSVDAGADLSGIQEITVSNEDWQASMNGGHIVNGGSVAELGSIAGSYSSYNDFWNTELNKVLAPGSEARNDPGVLRVIAQLASRPDMSSEELQNLLQGTDYYKNRTQGQLEWNDLSPAEQQKRIADAGAQLKDQWIQLVGTNRDDDWFNNAIKNYATLIASGAKGFNEVVSGWIKQEAVKWPESPWSRTLRSEQENERQRGVDVDNQTQAVQDLARKWGVQLSAQTASQWGSDIVTKNKSDAELTDYLKSQAQVLYPWKDKDMETDQAAQPWIQTYQRVMEKEGSLFDPQIQSALQQGMPAFQFEQQLKATPDWMHTKNAQDTLTGMVGDIGRQMGFN